MRSTRRSSTTREARRAPRGDLEHWEDRTKDLQDELKYLGLSNTERQKAVLLEKAREDIFAAGNDAATIRDINANLETQLGLLDQINETQQRISGWYQLADAIGRVASRVSSVRDELKRMLQEMIQIFMRRWILSLGASMTGGATSSALASGRPPPARARSAARRTA
jgi:hypothetical protein